MTLLTFVHKEKLLDLDHTFRMFVSLLVGSAAKTFPDHTHTQIQVNTKKAGILVVRTVASTTSIATVLYF